MAHTILLTRFPEYHAQAKAIQRSLGKEPASTATVRQAVADLADLAIKTLAETNDAFEALAAVVMALHPEVKRTPGDPRGGVGGQGGAGEVSRDLTVEDLR